jgi:hypothetical protein
MPGYRISKVVKVPLDYAFAWLTDFRDDDPKIIGGTPRRMLRKSKREFVWVQPYKRDGVQKFGVRIVKLKPPDSWRNDAINEEKESVYSYRLTPVGRSTRLTIEAKIRYKTIKPESMRELAHNLSADWEKYKASLEKDYSSGKPAVD